MESVNCGNCVSACCRADVVMDLSAEEVEFMKKGDTKLHHSNYFSLPGEELYVLDSDCGWLNDDGSCAVYMESGRPRACHDFTPGKSGCVSMRLESGVPTEIPAEVLEEVPVFDLSRSSAAISELSMMALTTF